MSHPTEREGFSQGLKRKKETTFQEIGCGLDGKSEQLRAPHVDFLFFFSFFFFFGLAFNFYKPSPSSKSRLVSTESAERLLETLRDYA
jgi:hypothetical protein